jgi:hypothetical protein
MYTGDEQGPSEEYIEEINKNGFNLHCHMTSIEFIKNYEEMLKILISNPNIYPSIERNKDFINKLNDRSFLDDVYINKPTLLELKKMGKTEILNSIRKILTPIGKDISKHDRFEMSGYDYDKPGDCTISNMNILNKFAYLGIYDYTSYLYLDFYKGCGTIYLKYFHENDDIEIGDLGGHGTTDIIYKIFELTIFSDKLTRRRR